MSLTFKDDNEATRLCHVYGGKDNNKFIYITFLEDKNKEIIRIKDPFSILTDKWFRDRKKNMKTTELIRIQHAILRGNMPDDDEELAEIYKEAMKILKKTQDRELIIDDGRLTPTMPKKNTVRSYTCGPTGSGKTTWVINFIKEILLAKGSMKIFIFSVLMEDEELDNLGVLRVSIDDSLLDNPIELDELKDTICVFDDIETFRNVKYRNCIANLRDQCLSEGRHHGICTICTNHQITDYKKTRAMILECEFITFFPQSGGLNAIKRLLQTYIGLAKDEMNKVLSLPSRWVTIYNRYPLCVIYESGCFMLGSQNTKPKYNDPLKTVDIKGDVTLHNDEEDEHNGYINPNHI